MWDEESEESITGYYPKTGSYVMEDRYELVNDGRATLEIVYVNPAHKLTTGFRLSFE